MVYRYITCSAVCMPLHALLSAVLLGKCFHIPAEGQQLQGSAGSADGQEQESFPGVFDKVSCYKVPSLWCPSGRISKLRTIMSYVHFSCPSNAAQPSCTQIPLFSFYLGKQMQGKGASSFTAPAQTFNLASSLPQL